MTEFGREERWTGQASGQSVRPSGRRGTISFAPFIEGVFVDAGLRWAWRDGRIIFDPGDLLQKFCEDDHRLLRNLWDEESGFCCQGQDRMFELAVLVVFKVGVSSHDHQGSSNDGHDRGRKQFLANPIGLLTMERLDLEGDLFISVIIFYLPSAEIQGSDVLTGIQVAIQQIGQ